MPLGRDGCQSFVLANLILEKIFFGFGLLRLKGLIYWPY